MYPDGDDKGSGRGNSGGHSRAVRTGERTGSRRVSQAAIDLIKDFERFRADKYLDAVGKPTIGYGHLIKQGERFDGPMSIGTAREVLRDDLGVAKSAVEKVRVPLTDAQHGALVSLVFNIGSGNFRRSTLLRLLNEGDYEGAADEFPKWRKAGGKVLKGLERRRKAEREMFIG